MALANVLPLLRFDFPQGLLRGVSLRRVMTGWIRLHRSIQNWEWFQDHKTCIVFINLLLEANWEPGKFMGCEIPAGSFVFGLNKFSGKTGISMQSVRTALNKLKSTNEITIKKTPKFSIITITNWNSYQGENEAINSRLTTDQQPTNNRLTTIEEYKNIRKEEVICIVEFMNSQLGTNYRASSQKTSKLIESRLKEKFTIDDFKKVILRKKEDWFESDMKAYLRPETLFGSKFESYLNEPEAKKYVPKFQEIDAEPIELTQAHMDQLRDILEKGKKRG